ncbi:NP1 [Bocaparvovirus lagomorph1]|uniref:Non-structural protein NP-1 n=1 Tax=Bocaparvovirus lagomorph1 TaxID=3052037 RepID=A0A0U3AZ58_9VIRU|nr:NP1 [Bocaparvovirus lagomorph1]ALT04903.1 NP1 [Bocaparvovirus lagomorph1]
MSSRHSPYPRKTSGDTTGSKTSWASSGSRENKGNHKNPSFSTASRPFLTRQQKKEILKPRALRKDPPKVFCATHRADSPDAPAVCGFFWHSNRIAGKGTDWIFTRGKQLFQERAKNNVIDWDMARDLLFSFKRECDQWYRNMLYHFRLGEPCDKCNYWDGAYRKYCARVNADYEKEINATSASQELTDEEAAAALDAAMADASH